MTNSVETSGPGGDQEDGDGGGRAPGNHIDPHGPGGGEGGAGSGRVERARRATRAALEDLGFVTFGYRFDRTHLAIEAAALWDDALGDDGPTVAVAGRLVALRHQGRSSFAQLEDRSGRIQLYLRRDETGDAWPLIERLDLDDHVGVTGRVFRTRAGEITVRATAIDLLAKSLRPLPRGKTEVLPDGQRVVHGGLQDPEIRYRQRYADFAVHPALRDIFRLRARVIATARRFLDARGYLEVETPVLQPLYGGATARPFSTHHHALDMPLYLRIADELYLKRLIVGGFERVYEIGHDFRNEGMDRTHNPEFTMLEWYQAYADYHDMLDMVEALLASIVVECLGTTRVERGGQSLEFAPPYRRIRFTDAIREACGVDVLEATDDALRAWLGAVGEPAEDVAVLPRGPLLDRVFSHAVQDALVQPTFVLDYPRPLSPLAKPHRGDPRLTERFELFVNGTELANAFSELNDPDDQRARFADQVRALAAGDAEAHPIDHDYLRALEYGMPPTGGVGMGIDRLVMLLADQASIRDVILFPAMRPERASPPPPALDV